MDRMKIIKRRLSMSLRSARPVDENLSELAEHAATDEPPTSRENGEKTQFKRKPLTQAAWMMGCHVNAYMRLKSVMSSLLASLTTVNCY